MFEGFEAVEWNRHERRCVVIGGIVLAHDVAMKTLIFTGRGGLRTDGLIHGRLVSYRPLASSKAPDQS